MLVGMSLRAGGVRQGAQRQAKRMAGQVQFHAGAFSASITVRMLCA